MTYVVLIYCLKKFTKKLFKSIQLKAMLKRYRYSYSFAVCSGYQVGHCDGVDKLNLNSMIIILHMKQLWSETMY